MYSHNILHFLNDLKPNIILTLNTTLDAIHTDKDDDVIIQHSTTYLHNTVTIVTYNTYIKALGG